MVTWAYADRALPIGYAQTISQPYVVARTLEALALNGTERVLEIGTGSGYVAALLTHLVREVHTIERLERLAVAASERLSRLGYVVHVVHGDGTQGWPDEAPYDAIAVAASGPAIPQALVDQLVVPGGRIVIPVQHGTTSILLRAVHVPKVGLVQDAIAEVRFVPLIGGESPPHRVAS
jgi:protein-L-isoaspartate(D-aspartate) O-methyltransferase